MPIAPPRAPGTGFTDRFTRPNGPVGNGWVANNTYPGNWQVVNNRLQDLSGGAQTSVSRDAGSNDFVQTVDVYTPPAGGGLIGIFNRVPVGINAAGGHLLMTDGGSFLAYPSTGAGTFGAATSTAPPRSGLIPGSHTWQVVNEGTQARWYVDGYLVMAITSLFGTSYNGVGYWGYNAVTYNATFGPSSVRRLGRDTTIGTTGLAVPGRP